jgi:CheY-like chemotaxis protein
VLKPFKINKWRSQSSEEEKELDKLQILIAESENELVSLFEAYLSLLGMNVEKASSGEKALDCFLESKKRIDHMTL